MACILFGYSILLHFKFETKKFDYLINNGTTLYYNMLLLANCI